MAEEKMVSVREPDIDYSTVQKSKVELPPNDGNCVMLADRKHNPTHGHCSDGGSCSGNCTMYRSKRSGGSWEIVAKEGEDVTFDSAYHYVCRCKK